MLSIELEALVERLEELARPVIPWLVPGVDDRQVQATVGVLPPDEVTTWFGWCNGVELHEGQTQDDVNVIPGYAPISLREAMEAKLAYSGDPVLGDHWVPILAGASGDIYAAVWQPGKPVQVAGVLVGEATEIEFASVEQMVNVFNECYRRGAFFVDSQRHLAMDPDIYDEVRDGIVR
ncbi:hypothetical protein [Streptomyces sp. NPDC051569]|uniref:hypothetical protein n=1 Tax=Streptomyces sp. NPDC051569 TaxID=3365661 RepID=UPI00378A4105